MSLGVAGNPWPWQTKCDSQKILPFLGAYLYAETLTQLAFTCSKLTIETLEKGVKYVPIYYVQS